MSHMNHKQAALLTAGVAVGETTDRATGSGAMTYSLAAESRTRILSFALGTTSTPTTSENLILSVNNPVLGTQFSHTVLATDMENATSVFYTEAILLEPGDIFRAEWTNTSGVTWGVSTVFADARGE